MRFALTFLFESDIFVKNNLLVDSIVQCNLQYLVCRRNEILLIGQEAGLVILSSDLMFHCTNSIYRISNGLLSIGEQYHPDGSVFGNVKRRLRSGQGGRRNMPPSYYYSGQFYKSNSIGVIQWQLVK